MDCSQEGFCVQVAICAVAGFLLYVGVLINLRQLWAQRNGRHLRLVKRRADSTIVRTAHYFLPPCLACFGTSAILFCLSRVGIIEIVSSAFENFGIFWIETWLFLVAWQTTNSAYQANQMASPKWMRASLFAIWVLYPVLTPIVHIVGALSDSAKIYALGNVQHVLAGVMLVVALTCSTARLAASLKARDLKMEAYASHSSVRQPFNAHMRMVGSCCAFSLAAVIMYSFFAFTSFTSGNPYLLQQPDVTVTTAMVVVAVLNVAGGATITYFMHCRIASPSELKTETNIEHNSRSGDTGLGHVNLTRPNLQVVSPKVSED